MSQSSYCYECIHYLGSGKCLAYPKKIPWSILSGDEDHEKKRKGQKGNFVHVQIKPIYFSINIHKRSPLHTPAISYI